jgi:hypothetical protein
MYCSQKKEAAVGDCYPERPSTDRMEEAPVHLNRGQEVVREAVDSLHSLMMIREVGLTAANTLPYVVVVSCPTMQAEDRQEAAGMKVAAHFVPVVGYEMDCSMSSDGHNPEVVPVVACSRCPLC